jgi:hypothetical protein
MEEVRPAEIVERVVTTVELCLSVKRNRRQTARKNDFQVCFNGSQLFVAHFHYSRKGSGESPGLLSSY